MNLIFIFTNCLLGIFFAKYFSLKVYQLEKRKNPFNPKSIRKYLAIPMYSFITKSYTLFLSELLGLVSFFIFSTGIIFFKNFSDNFEFLTFYFIFLTVLVSLLYLAIYDLITFSVPVEFTINLLFLGVVVNFLIGVSRYIILKVNGVEYFTHIYLGTFNNIFIFLISIFLTAFLVKISKEKGLGSGDVNIVGFVGLMLGSSSIGAFVFFTLISGSIVSIVYALKIKKFHRVIIPLVPFILIGFTIALNFSKLFISLLLT